MTSSRDDDVLIFFLIVISSNNYLQDLGSDIALSVAKLYIFGPLVTPVSIVALHPTLLE